MGVFLRYIFSQADPSPLVRPYRHRTRGEISTGQHVRGPPLLPGVPQGADGLQSALAKRRLCAELRQPAPAAGSCQPAASPAVPAARGKPSVGLHGLPFLPGVARGGCCPPRTPAIVSCFTAVRRYGAFSPSCLEPSLPSPPLPADHLRSPLLAALLLMRRRVPAGGRQGFPGLGKGNLEHLLGEERGEDRGCEPAWGREAGGEPAAIQPRTSVSRPLHNGPFCSGVLAAAVALLVPLRRCALRKARAPALHNGGGLSTRQLGAGGAGEAAGASSWQRGWGSGLCR